MGLSRGAICEILDGMSRGMRKFLVRSLVVVGVVGVRTIGRIGQIGQIGQIMSNVWLVLGWVIGYLLTEIDDLFYAYICNPERCWDSLRDYGSGR
ncbi:MAG: hypothetical protein G01um101416_1086 [Microgenomates group bacterium Gr01-1014_16]|nr:MAG: hypothetical protein G01um101416_1086 [Microgenomates group bacterium Gr01-1014_16]